MKRKTLAPFQEEYFFNLLSEGVPEFEAYEIARNKNEPCPSECPQCGRPLMLGKGFVGEPVLWCEEHGLVWEDTEGAIRRVI